MLTCQRKIPFKSCGLRYIAVYSVQCIVYSVVLSNNVHCHAVQFIKLQWGAAMFSANLQKV